MAPYFECRINKNTLHQTVFWRFFPLGYSFILCIFTIISINVPDHSHLLTKSNH